MSDQLGPLEEAWLQFNKDNDFSIECAECFEEGFKAALNDKLRFHSSYSGFISTLIVEFDIELQKKTGWGRNEIKDRFQKCLIRALTKTLDREKE